MDPKLANENLDFIRQSEYFRYLEEATIEPLLERAYRVDLYRGVNLPPPRGNHLVFLLSGTVDVVVARPRNLSNITRNSKVTAADEDSILFKTEAPGSCLNGLCDLLQVLTRDIANQTRTHKADVSSKRRSVAIPAWSSADSERGVWGVDYGVFTFRAASQVSIVMVPLTGGSGVPLDVSARMIQALTDRLYHVSLAKAVSHFGMDDEVVKFERRLHRQLNRRSGVEADLADLFTGLLDDSWYSALQQIDGPVVKRLSLFRRSYTEHGNNVDKNNKNNKNSSSSSSGNDDDDEAATADTSNQRESLGAASTSGSTLIEPRGRRRHSNLDVRSVAGTTAALTIDTSCSTLSNNFTQFSPTIMSMTERKEKLFTSWDRQKLQRKGYMKSAVVEAIFSLLGFSAERKEQQQQSNSGPTRSELTPGAEPGPFADNPAWREPWIPKSAESKLSTAAGFYERPKESYLPWSEMAEFLDSVEVLVFQEGAYVAHQGERHPGLCLVIEGELVASRSKEGLGPLDSPSYGEAFTVSPGQLLGYGSLQVNNRSMFDVQAAVETHVGFLPRAVVQRIVSRFPQAMLFLARRILDAMPPMIALTDFALDWIPAEAGVRICRKGDQPDSMYFLIKGRCRTTETIPYTGDQVTKEICAGESFGALEIYTGRPRPADVTAVRRSEVVRLRKSSYQTLALYHPPLALCLWERIAHTAPEIVERSVSIAHRPNSARFRTIAICPLSRAVPAERFRDFFLNALADTGICTRDGILECDSNMVIPSVGAPVYSRAGYVNLQNYLAHLQENVELLLLTADVTATSTWTEVCIANADLILLASMSDGPAAYSAMEKKIDESGTLAQRKLVLLTDGDGGAGSSANAPSLSGGSTREWIENRHWMRERAHIFKIAMPATHEIKSESDRHARRDFERMSRILFNRSIAVVLGGGGARGISHLGVLRAMEEEGIPVDIIGGTSMGAFVAAMYAKTGSVSETHRQTAAWSRGVRTWRYVLQDLTLPWLAATTGKVFNRQIRDVFTPDLLSADLKLDFFCSVTNLSQGSKNQTFYPGLEPVWQICRASMGIPPFVPPITVGGDLLIDGAFTANVPVFPAQGLGAETIFAFDVGHMDPLVDGSTHQSISGWAILLGKVLRGLGSTGPRAARANLPSLMDIVNHVSYATHTNELRLIRSLPGCLYLHQPTGHINVADYTMFEESYRVGYTSAKKWLAELRSQGRLDHLGVGIGSGGGAARGQSQEGQGGFATFTFDGVDQAPF